MAQIFVASNDNRVRDSVYSPTQQTYAISAEHLLLDMSKVMKIDILLVIAQA